MILYCIGALFYITLYKHEIRELFTMSPKGNTITNLGLLHMGSTTSGQRS